jgi:hypothetical protein
MGLLRVQLSINHNFFPETSNVYAIYLSYFFESFIYIKFSCIRTKVFYVILIASDSHRSALYSLHVTDLLSVLETLFPSPDVKNCKDTLHVWIGRNLETAPAKRLKTSVAIGHNSESDAALHLRKERQPFPKRSNYQRRKKSTNTIMLNVNHITCKTIHTSF